MVGYAVGQARDIQSVASTVLANTPTTWGQNNLALAYAAGNDFVKAKDLCQKVLTIDSTNVNAADILKQIQATGH